MKLIYAIKISFICYEGILFVIFLKMNFSDRNNDQNRNPLEGSHKTLSQNFTINPSYKLPPLYCIII